MKQNDLINHTKYHCFIIEKALNKIISFEGKRCETAIKSMDALRLIINFVKEKSSINRNMLEQLTDLHKDLNDSLVVDKKLDGHQSNDELIEWKKAKEHSHSLGIKINEKIKNIKPGFTIY